MDPHLEHPSPSSTSRGLVAGLVVAGLVCAILTAAQAITIHTVAGVLKVSAPGLEFLAGEPLARLKDGRAVRVELALVVLSGGGKSAVTESRQIFAVSYDLWEERFAVTIALPARSISHLAREAAEAWCVEQLGIPVGALGARAREPFWIRLEYRILDGDTSTARPDEEGFTLQGLIDRLSRRRKVASPLTVVEAGPFRLPAGAAGSSSR